MDLESFRALLSPAGQEALRAAEARQPREEDFLAHFQALSREFPAELCKAALETAILRQEAASKFPQSRRMYFNREALEQASASEVSVYRSGRYRPFTTLADLGCSIGGDTFGLAAAAPAIGIDLDPVRLAMAAANARVLGLEARVRFLQGDLTASLPLARSPEIALFFDPSRRAGGQRVFSVRAYSPPLSILRGWLADYPALGVKISPGVKLAELSDYGAEMEFISLRGDLKEAVLWFGPLKTAWRRATVLPGPHTLATAEIGDESGDAQLPRLPLDDPRAYLYEPDPAVLRAGLVMLLGERLEAVQLDPDIAYLTGHSQQDTPFARVWAVEDWFPFQLKRLRAYLRERRVGRVVVKKRGSPIQPETLTRNLRLEGPEERVVFLTHLKGKPIVIIARL
jgi:SAM-dependent methyltransferase